jgi:predicted Ser/Thr protein kinase
MNSATENPTCPSCGATIPANAPQGICPKCLMAAAVAMDTGPTGGKRPEPPSLERLAAAFPQLEVIEFIGQGGMGAVYKARQKALDRVVALKVLPPGIGGDPSFAERFTREAKALAKLLHPNIVALFEFGQADGIYYLLMEYVDGVSLGQLLRSSRVSAREALAIVPQICDALQYAHDQGIVHRDIKPENILLDRRGRVKVADFGLAKLVEANAPLTPTLSPSDGERVVGRPGEGESPFLTDAGKIMGTPNYMAPEQVEHPGEVDHRADIYALGVVFYQMLTGELPGKRMEPPSRKVQIDVRLDEVVMRALEKNPELRYQHVSEVKTIVETIVGDTGTSPAEPSLASAPARGRDYRTRQVLLGLPLVHVAWGIDPATGRPRVAKGILAVGPVAVGVVAVGFSAWGLCPCGLLSCGFWTTGLFAVGFWAVGLAAAGYQAVGLLALAFWHAVGLVAVGPTPVGLERIVVDKGMVGILFALAIGVAWLMDRLASVIGSASAALATIVAKPRQDWWTWWLFQSPDAGRICAHLTKEERKHLLVLLLLYSVWVMVTIFGIPALNGHMRDAGPGGWLVTAVWAGLFIASLPLIDRMMRHFFCSTDWARKQGITPDKLRLFSFSATPSGARGSALLVLVVLLLTLLVVEFLGGVSGSISVNKAAMPNQVQKRHSDRAALTAQNPSAPLAHVVHANTNNAGFGPMTECTVNFSEPEQDLFLSFETGSLMKEPGGRLNTPEPEKLHVADEVLTWAGSSGADLLIRFCVARLPRNGPFAKPQLILRSLDMAMISTNTRAWDTLSARDIATAVRSARPPSPWSGLFWGTPSEQAFLFRTRQGNAGILLVTGFTDKPRSVKLFYKLVQPESAEVSARQASVIHRNTNTAGSALPPQAVIVRVFTSADRPISGELAITEDNAWLVDCKKAQTIRLFEVENPGVDQCVLTYRAKLKKENLSEKAYLEMWCRFPGKGQFFSRGLDHAVTGSNGWASCQTPFFLKKGEKPDFIKLNLVVEGQGKVFIKDIELTAAPN